MLHNKPHLTSVHAKVRALHVSEVCKFQPTRNASRVELDSVVQCGALTSLMAITAAFGGMLAFKKLGFIHMFPERLHGTLKFIHRNVGDFLIKVLRYKTTTDIYDTPAAWFTDIHSRTHYSGAGAHTCGRIQGTLSAICNNLVTHAIKASHVLTHAGCLDPTLANDHCCVRHCDAYVSAATGQKQTACTCTAAIRFHCKPSWQIAVDQSVTR